MAAPEEMEKLKYPVGKFTKPDIITSQILNEWIKQIEVLPQQLNEIVTGLKKQQLHWKYRPGGWSIQQVIHHLADSHMNSIIRFKLALTENKPAIKPYFEDRWGELPDAHDVPVNASLQILEGLHRRWVYLLRSLDKKQLKKEFMHPEHNRAFTLEENIGIYAWHCRHHLAHIRQAIETQGRHWLSD